MAKPLLPTLKEKKRYIAFQVLAERNVSFEESKKAIVQSAETLFGHVGVAKMGLSVLRPRYEANKGILRVAHTHQHQARMALCFIDHVGREACSMRSLVSSGILKKAAQAL